ncbi:DUF3298 domain-containing protein [Pedobacter sp.]|uniref:DUF3298 and DUF4163 domain-containing protein n=1 Tax=Pedobacter sp. TaxID=1411316 RepID=UPI003D7F5AF9
MKKIFAVFLVAIMFACQQKKDHTENGINGNLTQEVTADTLTYSYDSVKVYSKTPLSPNRQVIDTAKAVITYPVFANKKLNQLVEENALFSYNPDKEKPKSYKESVTNFIADFDAFKNENKSSFQTWFRNIDINVLPQWKNYVGLQYTLVEYTGGAHGSTIITYKNYNARTLNLQTTDSLIKPGTKKELTKIAEQIFRKDEKLSPTQSLDNYFFEKGIFVLPENFKLNKNGITFLYNIYEIKPYSSGRTALFIPYNDIKQILQANPILPAIN